MNGDTPESARLFVLESDSKRHEVWLADHDKRLQTQERCSDTISELRDLIRNEILPQIKSLNECKIANEVIAKTKVPFWESVWGQRVWDFVKISVAVLITWGLTVNQFMAGGK